MVEARDVKKILYITMSNLGDALMGLPAFDFLKRACPEARMTVVAAPRTKCLFEHHPGVDELIVYDKHAPLSEKISLFCRLQKVGFDVIVDLKNTFYRMSLPARYKNPAWLRYPSWVKHSFQEHLFQAIIALRKGGEIGEEDLREAGAWRNPSFISAEDRLTAQGLLEQNGVASGDTLVLISFGARSDLKKWPVSAYAEAAADIRRKYGFKVCLVGTAADRESARDLIRAASCDIIDFTGETTFGSLAALIQRSDVVISNDSGVLHIASYLNRPVVGIYGPSDYRKYGPWSQKGIVVRKSVLCAPCGKASCSKERVVCLETVRPYDVVLAVRLVLESKGELEPEPRTRRILISRTDRIGDVLISTPVIKSLRDRFPTSYIAMMVSPYTKDLVDGNPYLDEVVIFDKEKTKGFLGTLAFSRALRRRAFDIAVILHPTVRVHLVCFLAGIRERLGYDRKASFFLTKTIPHKKQEGARHEVEYNYDLLKLLGLEEVDRCLYMPIKAASEKFVDELLTEAGIGPQEKLVAVNPAASCISRRWPLRKFAEVIDKITASCGVRVVIVADSIHRTISQELAVLAASAPVDLSGRLNLSQLASLFRRSALVISNDSGPVHLSVAVGTPVISIFGRNQPGLSPRRWGPLGACDVVLHKKTDCVTCLAHACINSFKCLEAIGVDEVVRHAEQILMETSAQTGENRRKIEVIGKR